MTAVRTLLAIAVSLWLTLASTPVAAQQDDDIQLLSVDASGHPTVVLSVAIPPALGTEPLQGSDFAITEEGQPQPLAIRDVRDDIEVILAIDTSLSMQPNDALSRAKSAAATLVAELPASARIGVVGFGSEAVVAAQLTEDREVVAAAIDTLDFSGDTALWDALVLGSSMFRGSVNTSRYLIVLTDGVDDGSNNDRSQAAGALATSEASLYAVGLQTNQPDFEDLEATVLEVGGVFAPAESLEVLDPLYADIAERLRSRYRLEFDADGIGEREIVISVATEGGLATLRRIIDVGGSATAAVTTPVAEPVYPSALNSRVSPKVEWLGQGWNFWAGVAAMFLCFAVLGYLIVRPVQEVRLASIGETGEAVSGVSRRITGTANEFVGGTARGSQLDRALDGAGMEIRPGELLVLTLAASVVGLLAGLALAGGFVAVLFALLPAMATFAVISRRLRRRRNNFADQLSGTLTIMAGALRAGRGLPQTIDLVAEESPSPTSDEFRRVVIESRVGRDLSSSLESVGDRMQNEDFFWVAEAIAINRELGGDLAEILDNISSVVRDRNQVRQQIQALAAEGRLSSYVLIALPIVVFFYMQIVNPDYGSELLTGRGLVALIVGIIGMIIGWFWMKSLVKLRY